LRVVAHSDTDGICAAVQLVCTKNYSDRDVHFTKQWGEFDNTTQIMLDTHNFEFTGIIYDHHGYFWELVALKKLIKTSNWFWFPSCTSIGIYEKFKTSIPKEFKWLHIIGAVADQVSHLIPKKDWEMCPRLTESMLYPKGYYGSFKKMRKIFTCFYLSKWINTGRYIRRPEIPFQFLLQNDLEDILLGSTNELEEWRNIIFEVGRAITSQREGGLIRSSPPPRILQNGVFLWLVKTKIIKKYPPLQVHSKICSQICANRDKLSLQLCKVFVVLNLDTEGDFYEASIRTGDLDCRKVMSTLNPDVYKNRLGHYHAMGFEVKKDQVKDFITRLGEVNMDES